ncbi:glycosyltransferase 61 family protein [Longimicrobium terrae]|uniref:Capsular polysaccharide biosynthesis protein n=1 Tax=Longimicrobium terrae TaxID=1639882 RepID=A0A841GTS6_9BACT|nr:capsular polysaccharide biosynthesis protein [Longimicrobium terrae]MBB6068578.1 capsular polysaccharide biosynthesis protein [Longimicrobium terrae]NNC27765.1 glycosyltransferase family 61 protein [Longimicrobium terrae]
MSGDGPAGLRGAVRALLGRGGPPRKWRATADAVARGEAVWHPARPAEAAVCAPAAVHGGGVMEWSGPVADTFPALGVVEIAGAALAGPHGWAFTRGGHLLPELTWFGGDVAAMRLPRSRETERLRGVCLSLASDSASRNYSHFLLDALPRLGVFLDAGFALSAMDHVLCPVPPSANAERILGRAGIDPARIVWARPGVSYRPDVALVPAFPGLRRNVPAWVPAFLRGMMAPLPPPSGRRLWVTRRGGQRTIANEAEIEPVLARHGFEVYEPGSHPDQPEDFASASVVAGPHGAALSNLAFCAPETAVLEVVPSDHRYPHYYSLSCAAGLRYACLPAPSAGTRPAGTAGPSPFDCTVDPVALDDALWRLTDGP